MIIIVGLGNPGKKYQETRHNLGFQAADEFLKKNRDVYFFSDFKLRKEISSLISEGKFNDERIILAKPQAFMNNSGQAVKKIIRNWTSPSRHPLETKNLIVIHDDIDLPLGKIRIVKNRGSAGHKGVESIIRELKTKNFVRLRIGINQFAQNQKSIRQPADKNQKFDEFVLQNFKKDEEKIVKEVIKKTADVINFFLKEGLEKTMNKFNK